MPLARSLVVGCLVVASPAVAQEWTRFRGPNGSGVSGATTIPARWTERDVNWKVELPGVGHSSPVLWGDRIFVTAAEEATGNRVLLCLRAGDGKTLWTRSFGGEKTGKHRDNSFATATPAVDARRVYVAWGNAREYLVAALDHDGAEVWRTDLGSFKAGHGFGPSPVVVDDLLVLARDQDGPGTLVGLACETGKTCWSVPRKTKAHYATPCVFRPAGRAPEVVFASYEQGVTAVDAKTGRVAWEVDVFDKRHVETSISSPVVTNDLVLATSGWLGVRQEVVAVRPHAGAEKEKPAEAYRIDRGAPLCTTPLAQGGLLFLWSDGGTVTCADVKTGKTHWSERVGGSYYGSPVWVDGRLYGVSREGEVVVLAAAERFELLARNPLGEGSHSTPAVAGGRMYLRTFSHLFSVGGK